MSRSFSQMRSEPMLGLGPTSNRDVRMGIVLHLYVDSNGWGGVGGGEELPRRFMKIFIPTQISPNGGTKTICIMRLKIIKISPLWVMWGIVPRQCEAGPPWHDSARRLYRESSLCLWIPFACDKEILLIVS